MNVFKYAPIPADDSNAYVLINLYECWVMTAESKFIIEYSRPWDPNEETRNSRRSISFDELDRIKPGFSKVLINLFATPTTSSSATNREVTMANTIAAYLFGAYTDLRLAGPITTDYPYVTKLFGVNTSLSGQNYSISGVAFDITELSDNGIPTLRIRSYLNQIVTADQIESIWPNSVKIVAAMEVLDYRPHEIGSHLNKMLMTGEGVLAVDLPSFDL